VSLGILSACRQSPEEKMDKAVLWFTKDLNLTPGQKNEIEQDKIEALDDLREFRKDRMMILSEIEKELTIGKSDSERLKRFYLERIEKRKAFTYKWIEKWAHFQGTLTPEQNRNLILKVRKIRDRIEETK
jgi:hypothetical protein